jgi:ubiquinone/menaquinone biosynthesis C-methylase UbiE
MHRGAIVPWAARYDALVWLLALGRPQRLYRKLLAAARLQAGESVLDVGCGTGSLALVAQEQVGERAEVVGVDASPNMIRRATMKAHRAGVGAKFIDGYAQELPFPDAHFDVVVNTLMLHHLPREDRRLVVREMHRVLKPGGRLLTVDFVPSGHKRGIVARIHGRGSGVSPRAIEELVRDAGFSVRDSGASGVLELQYVVAVRQSNAFTAPRSTPTT